MRTSITAFLFTFLFTAFAFTCGNPVNNNSGNRQLAALSINVLDIKKVAETIAKDVGSVSNIHVGSSGKNVIIFEETHISIACQIEIAIMLNRLVKDFNINDIALEGEFAKVGRLNPVWFHQLQMPREKNDYAVQSLQEGEINSAEFIALIYPQANVFGIEIEDEYKVDISDAAKHSVTMYLFGIATTSITQAQYNEFERLVNAKKIEEAQKYIFGLNTFTKEKYEILSSDKVMSAEESIKLYEEIKQKATAVNANIDPGFRKGMDEVIYFFKMASQRSHTMVRNTIAHPVNSTALIIGAAHTQEVEKILASQNHSYAVISPFSFKNKIKQGNLAYPLYKRKLDRLPVDTLMLGKLLTSKRKPQPVINQPWFQPRTELNLATRSIVDAFEAGERPPFASLHERFARFTHIKINTSSFEVIGDDVVFQVDIKNNLGEWKPAWIRAAQVVDEALDTDLETQLKIALETVKKQSEATKKEIIIGKGDRTYEIKEEGDKVEIKAISPKIIMAIATDETTIKSMSSI